MRKTGLVYHEDYLKHEQPFPHPEKPQRLSETIDYFRKKGILGKTIALSPRPVSREELMRVHSREHVDFLENICFCGGGFLDSDTYASRETYRIASLAAGGAVLAGDSVMEGKVDNAFALVRPPGHHATKNRGMGFCYFNNAAILVKHLQAKYGLKKIFLFDWDAHAFNGTMDIFYNCWDVLDVSIHQDPKTLYPGVGFINQIGDKEGVGYTVNIPVPPGTGDSDYLHILQEFILPLISSYKPEFMVVSAGQDSHKDDPLAQLSLTTGFYGTMTRLMLEMAEKYCKGRTAVVLEGGYNIDALAKSNYEITCALLGVNSGGGLAKTDSVRDSTERIVKTLKDIFGAYHKI